MAALDTTSFSLKQYSDFDITPGSHWGSSWTPYMGYEQNVDIFAELVVEGFQDLVLPRVAVSGLPVLVVTTLPE